MFCCTLWQVKHFTEYQLHGGKSKLKALNNSEKLTLSTLRKKNLVVSDLFAFAESKLNSC